MFNHFKITKNFLAFIVPYIILYSIYIQLNGKISPGGGFQAGVLFASGAIAIELLFGINNYNRNFKVNILLGIAAFGVIIYAFTGIICILLGGNYLDYNAIGKDDFIGQFIGIFLIETGVGITVASIMCLLFSVLRELGKPKEEE